MKIAVAQLGARRHYAIPLILHRAGLLSKLYTDMWFTRRMQVLMSRLPLGRIGLGRRAGTRKTSISDDRVVSFLRFGIEYAWRRRTARCLTESTALHLEAAEEFNRLICREGLRKCTAVYGFNSASQHLFEYCRHRRIRRVLDQTLVAHEVQERLLMQERARWYEFVRAEPNNMGDTFSAREKAEWTLADIILCGSELVRESIRDCGGPIEKCAVVPYGTRTKTQVGDEPSRRPVRPLRVLFVGEIGLRKGVLYLIDAVRSFTRHEVESLLVGGMSLRPEKLAEHCPDNVRIVGPVPRSDVDDFYRWADVFCLPSLCEGSAVATYEALAEGLPVVTTPNSGSIVRHGVDGFLVRAADSSSVAEALRNFVECPELVTQMSRNARARSMYGSLESYGRRLVETIRARLG